MPSSQVNYNVADLDVTHIRLRHASLSKMKHIELFRCSTLHSYGCDVCMLAKSHKLPFHRSENRAENCFELIHINLWAPYKTQTMNGASYCVTIVDDHSR